jgi:Uncharacterized conserved protein
MRQKIFSFGDQFTIKDEFNNDCYFVKGKVFSLGNKLSFQDHSGNELIYIKQKVMSFSPTYEIYKDSRLFAVLKKEIFSFFRCRFIIEGVTSGPMNVEGSFLDHEYTFSRNGGSIANVSKQFFSFSDTYGIDIEAYEDDIFILACVVIIDMICHGDKEH